MRLCIPDSSAPTTLPFVKRKWVLVADGNRTTLLSIAHDTHYVDVDDDMFGAADRDAPVPTVEAWSDAPLAPEHDIVFVDKICKMLADRHFAFDVLCVLGPPDMLDYIRHVLPTRVLAKARFGIPQTPFRPVWHEMGRPGNEAFGLD